LPRGGGLPSPNCPPPAGDALTADPATEGFTPDRLAGVLSFHKATILRTDVKGERGDPCGRRRVEAGVRVLVLVNVPVSVAVPVNVRENVLGV
jgi:hypothetical protein